MYRALVVALLMLSGALQYRLWAGDPNLFQNWQLQQRIEVQHQENDRLMARNGLLRAEVDSLKQDLAALEERARHDLGMVRKDETFYQLLDTMP